MDYTIIMLDEILRIEGGAQYTDRAHDRGGPTKYGITLATLAAWRKRPTTAEDVKNLQQDEARDIYRTEYLLKPNIGVINSMRLRWHVLDAAVQHGPGNSVKMLQRALYVAPRDGRIGPITAAAVDVAVISVACERYIAKRCRFYAELINDPDEAQQAIHNGWIWFKRVAWACEFAARLPQ